MTEWETPFKYLETGKGSMVSDGDDLVILTIGHVGNYIKTVKERLIGSGITAAHYNMLFLKPIDEDILHQIFRKFRKVITVEDGTVNGGLGSTVIGFMTDNNYKATVVRLGIPDRFIEHGSIEELQRECGFDTDGILKAVFDLFPDKK